MKRIGAVIVFREGITDEQAVKALATIQESLELPQTSSKPEYFMKGRQRCVRYVEKMFTFHDLIEEFDDKQGSPVWYIP